MTLAGQQALVDLRIDHLRTARTGLPEIVYGEGKTPAQCVRAMKQLIQHDARPAIVSRVDEVTARALTTVVPGAKHDPVGRLVTANHRSPDPGLGTVAVVCAGTSDLPVARECVTVLDACAIPRRLVVDVGVAGLQRLVDQIPTLATAHVTIVVAGMEGALPTVVAGLVAGPIIAVPTSVGYGSSFDGLAALLSMLNACSPGVTVVNIDNGLGAALAAARILERRSDQALE